MSRLNAALLFFILLLGISCRISLGLHARQFPVARVAHVSADSTAAAGTCFFDCIKLVKGKRRSRELAHAAHWQSIVEVPGLHVPSPNRLQARSGPLVPLSPIPIEAFHPPRALPASVVG